MATPEITEKRKLKRFEKSSTIKLSIICSINSVMDNSNLGWNYANINTRNESVMNIFC